MKPRPGWKPSPRDVELLNTLINALQDMEIKLKRLVRGLREKERYYLGLCRHALVKEKDELKAYVYACHVAGIRSTLRLTYKIEACVIQLKVRLIGYREFISVWEVIGPTLPTVQETARKISESLPWVKSYVESLERYVNDLFNGLGEFGNIDMENVVEKIDVHSMVPREILEEVKKLSEAEIEAELPSPPAAIAAASASPEPSPADEQAIAMAAASSGSLNDAFTSLAQRMGISDVLNDSELRAALEKLRLNGRAESRRWR